MHKDSVGTCAPGAEWARGSIPNSRLRSTVRQGLGTEGWYVVA